MLTELRIRNFAIIEALTLPLGQGFNVLTGETGAGKSIIVGALGLLLGERGTADVVRTGTDKATVEGVLGRRPGVLSVEANLVGQTATVTFSRSGSANALVFGVTRAWAKPAIPSRSSRAAAR